MLFTIYWACLHLYLQQNSLKLRGEMWELKPDLSLTHISPITSKFGHKFYSKVFHLVIIKMTLLWTTQVKILKFKCWIVSVELAESVNVDKMLHCIWIMCKANHLRIRVAHKEKWCIKFYILTMASVLYNQNNIIHLSLKCIYRQHSYIWLIWTNLSFSYSLSTLQLSNPLIYCFSSLSPSISRLIHLLVDNSLS